MEFISVIFVLAVLAGIVFVQLGARQQISVDSPLPPAEAEQAIKKYFGATWQSDDGPGDFNFTRRFGRDPATLSVNLEPASAGGSQIGIFVGGSHTLFGVMGHAFLMWRKKRGLAKRLS